MSPGFVQPAEKITPELVLLGVFIALALWTARLPASDVGATMVFTHPGGLNSRSSLESVRNRIMAGEQPWTGAFETLRQSSHANRKPVAMTHIDSSSDDAWKSRDNALAAYAQALIWRLGDDEAYARRSVAILNAWSELQGFTSDSEQDKLQAGWIGAVFAQAAEIMRGYDGWEATDITQFQAMFRRAFYPQLTTASFWNGNVDLTQIDAVFSIAVFNEDEALFKLGLERFERRNPAYFYLEGDPAESRTIDGDGDDLQAFWHHPVKWVDGLTQESCRDNGHHAQFALGSALHAAEIAWNQGIDLYTPNQRRFTSAMELLASQLLSGSVNTCRETEPASSRVGSWEVGYRHYQHRMGVDLPYSARLIDQQIRRESIRADWNLAFETLTQGSLMEFEPPAEM